MSIFQKIASVFADKAIAPKLENAAIAFGRQYFCRQKSRRRHYS